MIRSTFAILLLFFARMVSCDETTVLQVRGDISVKANTPLAFLFHSFVDTSNAELLRAKTPNSNPFFVLYEGNRFLFDYDPTGTQEFRNVSYKLTKTDTSLVSAVSNTLKESDNDIKTTMVGNALLVSEISLSARPDWPLNTTVVETRDTTLTIQSAENLLRKRYNYNIPPKHSVFKNCNPNEIVTMPGNAMTVRELLIRMLSQAAEETYKKSSALNWIVIYQVGSGPVASANAPMNFMLTQAVSRR